MHRTLFNTPVVSSVLRLLSRMILALSGWKTQGSLPADTPKCVLIAAPHTSNWDLPFTLMAAFVLHLNIYWMGKESIFRPPFRGLMRWLGGIAIHREHASNQVAGSAQAIVASIQALQLVVSPEGTRSKTRRWKTGFYYIALSAKVPIVLAYMDYSCKVMGLGPVFHPTGDLDADMQAIKAFYAPIRGKNVLQFDADK